MKINKEEIPVAMEAPGTIMRNLKGYGGMTAGDVFYMPPGHTAVVTKNLKFLDFSPEKELDLVLAHIAKKMTESQDK